MLLGSSDEDSIDGEIKVKEKIPNTFSDNKDIEDILGTSQSPLPKDEEKIKSDLDSDSDDSQELSNLKLDKDKTNSFFKINNPFFS